MTSSNNNLDNTYTVRPLGACAWVESVTIDEARSEAREANDRGLRNVVIIRDIDGVVIDDE